MSAGRSYQVARVLGRGGFGVVYLARFQGEGDFSKDVALKILNPNVLSPNADIVRRLRDEARILGLLNHRAIVQVDRLIELRGRWTVVMEYAEGMDLARILKLGPVPPGAALEIAAEVAGALHAAYTRRNASGEIMRLHHRDIKPSNLQITPFGAVKVLDFGIARADFEGREAHSTRLGGRFGTPAYMPPERLYLKQDGPEGDIYALGTVLFEMIVGREFGHACRLPERHEELLADSLGDLGAVPGVDGDIVDLVGSMLAWDPKARPTSEWVERRCITLRGRPGGEPLRYWAARVVGEMLEQFEHNTAVPPQEFLEEGVDEDLTGHVLAEGDTGPSNAHNGEPTSSSTFHSEGWPPQTTWRQLRLPAVIVGFLAVTAGAIGLVYRARQGDEAPAPVVVAPVAAEPAVEVSAGGSPPVGSTTPSAEQPVEKQQPVVKIPVNRGGKANPVVQGTGAVSPPEPVPVTVVEVPPPPKPASVLFVGDAISTTLRGAGGGEPWSLPAEVPPGSYTLTAEFSDGASSPVFSLTLSEGQKRTVECWKRYQRCKEQK